MNVKVLVARKERDINQRDLAERTGISQADISRIERGGWIPPADIQDKLAEALGTTASALFGSQAQVAS